MFSTAKNYLMYSMIIVTLSSVGFTGYNTYKCRRLLAERGVVECELRSNIEDLTEVIVDKNSEIARLNLVIESNTFSYAWEVISELPTSTQVEELTYEDFNDSIYESGSISF